MLAPYSEDKRIFNEELTSDEDEERSAKPTSVEDYGFTMLTETHNQSLKTRQYYPTITDNEDGFK